MVGMEGFSEQGQPGDWDMAVGSVRGFRWWRLVLSFREIDPQPVTRYYAEPVTQLKSFTSFPGDLELRQGVISAGQSWLPEVCDSRVQGMYNGLWRARQRDEQGRYVAKCSKYLMGDMHPSYVPAPGCGCGFWAYWDGLPQDFSTATQPCVTKQGNKLNVFIPIAGMVEGSGHVIIGEKGFRSEYARITDIATRLDGDCIYRDLDSVFDRENYVFDTRGVLVYTSVNPEFPRPAGEFLPFVTGVIGLPEEQIIKVVQYALQYCLGADFKQHSEVGTLLRDVKRDANYSHG